ncbi:uncharacterized protein LOC134214348 [Armigeres subalbatus]|uniref:uncharacterized protein LOC134214348 n=1 Tax=Armigeres subalbatus TaxID=124917 RepID=UPI002ED211C7
MSGCILVATGSEVSDGESVKFITNSLTRLIHRKADKLLCKNETKMTLVNLTAKRFQDMKEELQPCSDSMDKDVAEDAPRILTIKDSSALSTRETSPKHRITGGMLQQVGQHSHDQY